VEGRAGDSKQIFRETIIGNSHKLVEWKIGKQKKPEGFKAPLMGLPTSHHLWWWLLTSKKYKWCEIIIN
jgi:hypothetical protein